jgi:hypothetical protein
MTGESANNRLALILNRRESGISGGGGLRIGGDRVCGAKSGAALMVEQAEETTGGRVRERI